MTFIHAYLLGGLSLIAVPVLVHLIMREKPKHALFPAFRFLRQTYQTNRRKLRLHHLLLLLLRILLIALLCMALARPRLYSERLLFFGQKQPVTVALLFDTSSSMEYKRGGKDRLKEAKERAEGLIKELPPGSRIAVLDSAERGGQFLKDPKEIQARLEALQIRSDNKSLTQQIEWTFTEFKNQEKETPPGLDPPPRFLYIFSDRGMASWNSSYAGTLKQPKGSRSLFVDVGVEKPVDFAIQEIKAQPPAIPPGLSTEMVATVRVTGSESENLLRATIGKQSFSPEPVKPENGEVQQIPFRQRARRENEEESKGLPIGIHQGIFRLDGTDQLPFNNKAFVTFQVRSGKKVLTIAEAKKEAGLWDRALTLSGFSSVVRTIGEAENFTLNDLTAYDVVCLYELISPPDSLWQTLEQFVRQGGGLTVVPGGEEARLAAYRTAAAQKVLPGLLEDVVKPKEPAEWAWERVSRDHLIMKSFFRWRRIPNIDFRSPDRLPIAYRFWNVKPFDQGVGIITTYDSEKDNPALLERKVGEGKVLLFTLPLTRTANGNPWHHYWQSSFAVALIGEAQKYLSGELTMPEMSFRTGERITIPLPPGPLASAYTLFGTGATEGITLSPPEEGARRALIINRRLAPGNYQIEDDKKQVVTGFSVNVPPDESNLSKVSASVIEKLLGKDSVVPVDHATSLKDALEGRPQPLELLPWLMLLLLLFLAGENLLANRKRSEESAAIPSRAMVSLRAITVLGLWTGGGLILGTALGLFGISGYPGPVAGAGLTGALGFCHAIVLLSSFGKRDTAILGGLLGSMLGLLYGGLVLARMEWLSPLAALTLGMLTGAGFMALDGWLSAFSRERKQAMA